MKPGLVNQSGLFYYFVIGTIILFILFVKMNIIE